MRDAIWKALADVAGGRALELVAELDARRTRTFDLDTWRGSFSAATRRVGNSSLDGAEIQRLRGTGIDWLLSIDELARGLLLLELETRMAPEAFLEQVVGLYRTGDNGERQAILRALSLFAAPASFVDLAVDACRSSVVPVFAAIACDNPFPRDHFADAAFCQMALKTIFLGLPAMTVRGLEARGGPELRRMARDYVSELTAAGRPIPVDLALLGARP